ARRSEKEIRCTIHPPPPVGRPVSDGSHPPHEALAGGGVLPLQRRDPPGGRFPRARDRLSSALADLRRRRRPACGGGTAPSTYIDHGPVNAGAPRHRCSPWA